MPNSDRANKLESTYQSVKDKGNCRDEITSHWASGASYVLLSE